MTSKQEQPQPPITLDDIIAGKVRIGDTVFIMKETKPRQVKSIIIYFEAPTSLELTNDGRFADRTGSAVDDPRAAPIANYAKIAYIETSAMGARGTEQTRLSTGYSMQPSPTNS